MKINFLVPCNDLSGGLRVVTTYANGLLRKGHDVKVFCPQPNISTTCRAKSYIKQLLTQKINETHLDRFKGELISFNPENLKEIPQADAVFATAWQTAKWSMQLPNFHGERFYLIQGYETWTGQQELVDKTFRYPMHKIVVSNWLKKIVQEKSGDNVLLLQNGRDFSFSESLGEGFDRPFDIGFTYSPVPLKGAEKAFLLLNILKEEFQHLKFIAFGSEKPVTTLPKDTQFFERPSQAKIRDIYLSTKIWINTSEQEGFCLPILESMSLGCAPVSMDNLGVRDIVRNNYTGYIIEQGNIYAMYEKLKALIQNPQLKRRIANNALIQSEKFSWTNSINQMEELLLKSLQTTDYKKSA